jgi:hypothetical protein
LTTTFLVNPPAGLADVVYGIVVALLITGVLMALISFRVGKEKRSRLLVAGIVVIVAGAGVYFVGAPTQPSSITVNPGLVQVEASPFFNVQVPTAQISQAYVVNLTNWNISVSSRSDGSAFGSYLSGYFSLSNGAKAEVLSTGNTNLVLVLKDGTYVILGPSDFQAFLTSFDQNVMPVSSA